MRLRIKPWHFKFSCVIGEYRIHFHVTLFDFTRREV